MHSIKNGTILLSISPNWPLLSNIIFPTFICFIFKGLKALGSVVFVLCVININRREEMLIKKCIMKNIIRNTSIWQKIILKINILLKTSFCSIQNWLMQIIFRPKFQTFYNLPPIFINIMGLKIDKEEFTLIICPLLFACNIEEVILGFFTVHLWL